MKKQITKLFYANYKNKILFTWFLFLLLGVTLNAQNINWTSGYPKIDSEPIVTLEDDRTLQIRFTPLAANINNAVIEVQLPPNVEYVSASSPTPGITISASASGALATGKLVTVNITSNGNKLIQNNEVEFHVKVNAKCDAAGAAGFDVKVKSGATLVTAGQKTVTTNIVKPSLAITSSDGTINYPTQTTINTITYVLKTNTADKASSAKVTFTTDLVSTLSDFKLNGTTFTPTLATTSSNKIYTFEFTPAALGGSKIDNTNSKTITFKGGATQCGSHVVTSSVQFPHNSNCATNTGSMVTMAFGSLPVPEMTHVSTNYVNASDVVLGYTNVNMDGTTPTLIKTVFKNNGGSNANNIVFRANPYGQWCYLDTDNIWLQVGSGTKRKVTSGEINVVTRRGNNANYSYYKSGIAGVKAHTIDIAVADIVPAGQTITFWIPTVNGNIYDNTNKNVFYDYHTNTISGFVANITSVKSPCGDAGVVNPASLRIGYKNAPHYRQLPANMTIKGGQTRTQTIHVSTAGDVVPTEFHIKIPAWLSIGTVTMTPNLDGSGMPQTITTTTVGDETTITYSGTNYASHYLHIQYTAGVCGGTNQTGQIYYWANQMWSHPLEKISQVFQDVTLQCETAGISLDTFAIKRTTIGLKDSNDDKVPDDGTTAPENEVRHDVFVEGDEGYFYWKGTIEAPGGYKYLDIPIKTTGFTLASSGTPHVILTGSNTVSIGGTVTYTSTGNNNGYFRYQHAGLSTGTVIEIKAPFRVRAGRNNYDNIETEFYVSNTALPNPVFGSGAAGRVGKDKSSAPIGTYAMSRLNHWNKDTRNEEFTNNLPKNNLNIGYVDIFHGGYFAPPYFTKEVRFIEYLEKLEWNLPEGYILDSPITITPNIGGAKTLAADGGATTQKIIHDVASLYDLTFVGPGTPAAGKWQRPDDYWKLDLKGKVTATKAAKTGNSTMTRVATYRKPGGIATLSTLTVTFIYSGDGVNLEVLPKMVTAYGPTVNNPVLTITNPNSYTMKDVYFYIDGNVNNVKLKESGSGTIYIGTGLNNCWIKIPDLSSGDSKSFEMTYNYNGKSTCTDDTITVYTASGFRNSWAAPTGAALHLSDTAHVGVNDRFFIQTAPATVSGSITSNKDTVPHVSDGNYQIKVSFNTLSSTGALKNPEMILSVPKGQYCTGAQLEYPVGTFTAVNALINPTLAAIASGTEGSERTITLKLADAKGSDMLIPGNLTPGVTPAELTASIVLTMEASCQTEILNTLQYKGKVTGLSACNAAASGNNTEVVSPVLFPDISYNYLFDDIAITTTSGIRAFNEIQTQDTLLLAIKKLIGSTNMMSTSDSIEIQIPQELDVEGSLMYFQGAGNMNGITGTTVTIGNNAIASGVRTLSFPMPIAAYNGATNKGVGDNVIYKIPVKYTPNGQSRAANPVDSILPTIFSKVQFGTCLPQTAPIGNGKDSIALMTADSIPYIVYVGDTATLKITSNGFGGSWYANKTSVTALSTSNPWLHTPTDSTALGDTTYYFSSIVNGHDYGRLPYTLRIYIHPWFIQNLDTFKYLCEEEDSLFVRAGGMDVTYQWYFDLTSPITGATDTCYVTGITGKYHVLVTDSVGETISSDTMDLYLNVVPVFTKNLPQKVKECDRFGHTLKAETTGHYLLYQWYRDGIAIPGANSASYYALSQDSSAFFRVSVKTLCGDSIMSNQCYINFCDQNDSILRNCFDLTFKFISSRF